MNTSELLKEFIESIDEEINKKEKDSKSKPYILKNGKVDFNPDSDSRIYKFNDFTSHIFPDSPAEIKIIEENNEKIYNGTVLGVENDVLSLYIPDKNLPDFIKKALMTVDETQLLRNIRETIVKIKENEENPPLILANKVFGLDKIKSNLFQCDSLPSSLNNSQKNAIKLSLGSDVTFIWGPPGTGKSATLGTIAKLLMKSNKSILISAHTNEAVDGLMEKIIEDIPASNLSEGEILRWRTTQSEKIKHITPSAIISNKIEDLNNKREKLTLEMAKIENELENLKKKYHILNDKLSRLYELLDEEKKLKSILDNNNFLLKEKQILASNINNQIYEITKLIKKHEKSNMIIKLIKKRKISKLKDNLSKLNVDYNCLLEELKVINESFIINKGLYKELIDELEKYKKELSDLHISEKELYLIKQNIEKLTAVKTKISKDIDKIQLEMDSLKGYEYELLQKSKILGTTLTTATINSHLRKKSFDVVIVDEVSMAPCPSLYATCSLGKEKVILCGDFYQLSPISISNRAKWLSNSIFDIKGITDKIKNNENIKELAILDTQYRTHPQIANSIVDIVYHGKLFNGLNSNHKNFYSQHLSPYPGYQCILIDTSNNESISNPWCKRKNGSWINENTAEIAIKLTIKALNSGIKSIGIITPYREQATLYKSKIKELKENYINCKIEAATVHKYQGRQMDMIIFDIVDGYGKHNLTPLLNGYHGSEAMRLINVATTRAIGKFIVIADVNYIEQKLINGKNTILYQWIQYMKNQKHVYYGQE